MERHAGDHIGGDTSRLAAAFVACTLPKAEWTHQAHLRVGLWHRLRMPAGEALDALRDRIRRYNEATGGVNSDTDGYHETITRVYVRLIDGFVVAADTTRDEAISPTTDCSARRPYTAAGLLTVASASSR